MRGNEYRQKYKTWIVVHEDPSGGHAHKVFRLNHRRISSIIWRSNNGKNEKNG